MTQRRRERGLALVVVLWGIAALSLIVAALLATATSAAHVSRNAWREFDLRTAADSGVQQTILALFNPDPSLQPAIDGSAGRFTVNGVALTVAVQDEAGLIDLNTSTRDQLRDYFKVNGADDPDTLADRVIDWRTPKDTTSLNGETTQQYESRGYRPRLGPFQSVDELKLVAGMTDALFRRLAPGLTVYSHRADFDNRVAPREVLAVVPGMTGVALDQTIAQRPRSSALAGHAYTIDATAEAGRTRVTRHAVVLLTGDPNRPYWLLDWR